MRRGLHLTFPWGWDILTTITDVFLYSRVTPRYMDMTRSPVVYSLREKLRDRRKQHVWAQAMLSQNRNCT
jgi:hypothetical protein